MDFDESIMATTSMESWEKSHHEMMDKILPSEDSDCAYYNMSTEELFRCIEEQLADYPDEESSILINEEKWNNEEDWDAYPNEDSSVLIKDEMWNPKSPVTGIKLDYDAVPNFSTYGNILKDAFFNLPELHPLVNPRTAMPVPMHEWRGTKEKLCSLEVPLIKPYHPTQDHDYMKICTEDKDGVEVKEEIDEDEPDVDVWKIDNFSDEQTSTAEVSEPLTYRQVLRQVIKTETRRTSKRTADIRRKEQARKVSISNAVHVVLNTKKTRNVRQYKNIKPKNSVETTPSQSDIEEWHSHAVRPTYTKITKKKTSKGRIDHSESERHRREVLRRNFHSLSELIPVNFLRGEKASSQISKQKILNGAKGYIVEVYKCKSSYKAIYQRNRLWRDQMQKRNTSVLSKCMRRQK